MKRTNSLFVNARIKLTLWYVLVSLIISTLFSVLIFMGLQNELQRRAAPIKKRIVLDPQLQSQASKNYMLLQEDIQEVRERMILTLVYVNGFIAILAGGAGYLLAGKSLKPIETAMTRQRQFIADASHELRTPLTTLKASTDLVLSSKKLTVKEARKTFASNSEDISILKALTSDIIYLARLQESDTTPQKEIIDLKDVATNVVKTYSQIAQKKHITLVKKLDSINISGNKSDITKLISILLDNAIKYSKNKGTVTIISTSETKRPQLIIQDTGIGVDSTEIPHIFDRFYRADTARSKQNIEGYGLGLSIAKRIADQHDASIRVYSKKAVGTIFYVTFMHV